MVIKLSAATFDKLSRKETNGFLAFLAGNLSWDGKLLQLKTFNSNFVEKFLYEMQAEVY